MQADILAALWVAPASTSAPWASRPRRRPPSRASSRRRLDADDAAAQSRSRGSATRSAPAPARRRQPADLGEVAGLIAAALAQGNVTVSAEGKVIDLRGTGLHGQAFEPIELTGEEPDPPDPDR